MLNTRNSISEILLMKCSEAVQLLSQLSKKLLPLDLRDLSAWGMIGKFYLSRHYS